MGRRDTGSTGGHAGRASPLSQANSAPPGSWPHAPPSVALGSSFKARYIWARWGLWLKGTLSTVSRLHERLRLPAWDAALEPLQSGPQLEQENRSRQPTTIILVLMS